MVAKSMSIPVQNVIIGSYTDPDTGKEKIACACEDFTADSKKLYEAEKIIN